jgi:preprotein translocase subunit SecF
MKHALVFNIISLATFLLAVTFLFIKGLNLSIEFTGGVQVEAQYAQAADLEGLRKSMQKLGIGEPQVQNFGTARDVLLRFSLKDVQNPSIGTDNKLDEKKLTEQVLNAGGSAATIKRLEYVGPQVGDELTHDGLMALLFVVIGIMIYLAFRFEWKFAVSAIVANLHDVVIILGFFAFFQWEFSLSVLAAVLAVLGYSVNESVVIFDRIRENFRKVRGKSVEETIDNAITSTISRTVITHGCTQMMVLSMLIIGGPTLHGFALALTIGICFGIYSSVFVAAAVAMWLGVKREDLLKPVAEKTEDDGAVV